MQQGVTGQTIEEGIAITVFTIVLMFIKGASNLMHDRFLLAGCGFGD